mgnify:CR=1 FL=1
MIRLVDIALLAKLKTANPETELRWMPKTLGEKAAYAYYKPVGTNPDTVGRSSATLFRTEVARHPQANVPHGHTGHRHLYNQDRTALGFQRRLEVDAVYDLSLWSYRQLELDQMVSRLLYSLVYEPVQCIHSNEQYTFRVDTGDPVYSFKAQDEGETIRLYNATFSVRVLNTFWMLEEQVPTVIYPIVNVHALATSGEPVLLETLQLIPEGY